MRIRYFLLLICIALSFTATASAQAIQSVYTDLGEKKCKTLEANEEEGGSFLGECPGVAGYKLQVAEGDLRQNIIVIRPDGSKHDLNLWGLVGGGGFSSVGAKAEWRMQRQNGKLTPIALIVRFNVSTDPSDSSKITSFLTVSKITPKQICLTDSVTGANANQEARRLADSAGTRPCKTAE